ncbi:hypothetical protein [Peribacillus frigoritolerans]|uniref:hypothetical protein n=1 Tax=Peribacillus frigoritolerans TaxID=450367 RepID=UPI00227E6D02|nr:hypothetical protein [Peribacillus frigoritolerans]MCY9005640.1 hypothetical protein [Peribacillus frigoritolerans]
MKNGNYEFQIFHDGNHQSWRFEEKSTRNNFYDKVKNHFLKEEFLNKNDALTGNVNIVQISTYDNVGHAQVVPNRWYDGSSYKEILTFVEKEYKNI